MRALSRALGQQGEPIPTPWPELPIKPGPGDVILATAAPGVGKSTVALDWAWDLAKRGLPVLIHSTDTDYSDQAMRLAALEFDVTTDTVAQDKARYAKLLAQLELPIRWSDRHVSAEELIELLKAEVEYLGEAPVFVVVDVMTDMLAAEENVGEIRRIVRQLKAVARRYRTTVLALHHVKRGKAATGTSTVTLQDGLYGGEQDAQFVLGMWCPGEQTLRIAVLKNRRGPKHPEGLLAYDFRVDYPHARVSSRMAVMG